MVVVRIRPMMPREIKRGELNIVKAMGNHMVCLKDPVEVKNKEAIRNSPARRPKTGMANRFSSPSP